MVLSTLVAAAILGAAVTAQHGQPAAPSELVQLESDLRMQFDFAFRHDTDERNDRIKQLNSAVNAWLQSPQSAEDEQLLAEWLRSSIRQSMPGSNQSLPELPQFGAMEAVHVVEDKPPSRQLVVESPSRQLDVAEPREPRLPLAARNDANQEIVDVLSPDKTSRQLVVAQPDVTLLSVTALPQLRPAEVRVNLAELSARIAGYHDGLAEVEAELFYLPKQNLDAAAKPLRHLRQLASIYCFVKMYYDTLTEDERWAVTSPRSPVTVCEQFSKCLNKLADAGDNDFLRPFEAHGAADGNLELSQLREGLLAVLDRVED